MRGRYGLRIEQVRLRAMRALDAAAGGATGPALDERLAAVEEQLAALDPGREAHLVRALGLTLDELELLWTVVATCHDPRVAQHAHVLGGADARRGASLAVHAAIAGLDGARGQALALALGRAHPLIEQGLLVADELTTVSQPLGAPRRVAAWLAGDDMVDDDVAAAGGPVEVPAAPIWDPTQARVRERLVELLAPVRAAVLVIEGAPDSGRRTVLATARAAVAIDVRRLAPTAAALEAALRALRRETTLTATLPVIAGIDDLVDGEAGGGARLRTLARELDRFTGAVAVTSAVAGLELPVRRPIVRLTWPSAEVATRRAIWERALAARISVDDLAGLARRYRIGPGGVARATVAAEASARSRGGELTVGDVVEGVRADIAERLGGLAQRVETRQTWDDLVLTPETLDQVRAVIARVRLAHQVLDGWGFASKLARGTGVAALFSGPPGTGKTMVAGLIARELDLELYQVDLSKVVSKWVGETEKQLARIFEAAEAGHALLLFDEADALFAKRTEVKAAVDRYANLEVNYLLQRVEAFGGVTILTTNLDTSIDPALRRRLAAHITFWPPDDAEREALWRRMIPASAPVADGLDLEGLATQFPDMTGANIRNAVLAAAFLAASEGAVITQDHLVRAGKGEYRAMGRVLAGRRTG